MKKVYFIALIMIQAGLSFAQLNPNNFEIRLVSPGGEPGKFRVQMRCITPGPLPVAGSFCFDLSFRVWWNNVADATIVDIDGDQSTSIAGAINENGGNPVAGNSIPPSNGTPGVYVAFTVPDGFFEFPASWVEDQWVNITTINICSNPNCSPAGAPAGKDASDFLIQGFTPNIPNITTEDAYTPATGIPLPLNLISFNAKKSGEKDAYVNWTTANEENTSHFIVQRSFDKNIWSDVGSVGAAGYSIDIRNYELYDPNVNSGRTSRLQVYYRLKMFDLDGTNKYSPIQTVVFSNGSTQKANEFLIYPNPATDGVQVEWNTENLDQPTSLEFYDVTGKLMLTQTVSDNTNQEYVDFRNVSIQPGVYLLRIMSGTEAIEHKQIVVGQNK